MATNEDPDVTEQVEAFVAALPNVPAMPTRAIVAAVDFVAEGGPAVGRPLVGEISLDPDYRQFVALFGNHLKEIRVPGTDVRILCTFSAERRLVLLFAGDKSGDWNRWYRTAIPAAAELYSAYIKERA